MNNEPDPNEPIETTEPEKTAEPVEITESTVGDASAENTTPVEDTGILPPPIPVKIVSLASTIEGLLKTPTEVLHRLQEGDSAKVGRYLLFIAFGCLAAFGLILGMFSGDHQLWRAPLKVITGVAVSGLITLPSLYIFSCLNGLDVTLRSVAGVLASCLTLVSLLLIGLAPVLWIFTQSTESLPFVGFLALVFWLGSLLFGLRLVMKSVDVTRETNRSFLHLWSIIFIFVTLQMSTALRPIIGTADTLLPTEKKFFLNHWLDEMSGEKRS
jgi:hypothetical protein